MAPGGLPHKRGLKTCFRGKIYMPIRLNEVGKRPVAGRRVRPRLEETSHTHMRGSRFACKRPPLAKEGGLRSPTTSATETSRLIQAGETR